MNRTLKYLSLILALLFVMAGSTMIAFAYDGDIAVVAEGEDVGGGDAGGGDSGGVVDPGGNAGGEVGGGDNGGAVDPGGNSGGDNGSGTGVDNGSGTGTGVDNGSGTGTGVDNGSGTGTGTGTGTDYSYTNDANQNSAGYNNEYYTYDEYGDGVGNEAAAGSVTSNTTLYQSSGLSDKEAAPNEWSEITLDEKTVTTGVSSFKSIKTNTNERAGEWIVYLGYLLIGFSVLGILYFIIATIAQRKHDRDMERLERRSAATAPPRSAQTRYAQPGSTAVRTAEPERYQARAAAPRTTRYSDEAYRSRRVSSRADTGEVYVPRRTRAK